MPHYSPRASSASQPSSTSLPANLSTSAFKAGMAVVANTLAAKAADGKLYMALEPGKPGSSLLPLSQASDIFNGLQSLPTLFATGVQGRIASVVLPSGNVLLLWAEAQAPYNVKLCIVDPHGVPQFGGAKTVGPSSISGGGGLPWVCAALLANGNVVLAYNAGGKPVFAIYDQTATLVKAPTAVDAASTVYALSVAALKGGNFVLCYNILSTNEVPTYAVYNANGVQVLAATALRAAPANNATSVASAVCALAAGGFVCAYSINVGGSNSNYFKRFDAAGVLQGSESLLRSGNVTNSGVVMRPMAGGGFAIIETADVRLNVLNATGVLQGTGLSREPGFTQNNIAIASHPAFDGGVITWQSGTSGVVKAMTYNAAGGNNTVNVSNTASNSGQVLALMDAIGNCVIAWADSSHKLAAASYHANLIQIASNVYPAMVADLNASALAGTAAYLSSPLHPSASTFMLALPTVSGNAAFGIFNAYVAARTTVGMFTANAAAGTNVNVQFSGVATLSTAFDNILVADYRAQSQIGIKFSVVGNSVLMWGVQ